MADNEAVKTEETSPEEVKTEACCCGCSGAPVVGSELVLEHTPLRKIALGYKVAAGLTGLYFLVSTFLRVKDYAQVPAEYMGQFWKMVAFSTLLSLIVTVLVAMTFYAIAECIKVLVEAAQNIRTIRDTVKKDCCK